MRSENNALSQLSVVHSAVFIAIVAFVAFAPTLRNEFTYDDRVVVSENEAGLIALRAPSVTFSSDYFALSTEATWRPLVTVSYVVDHAIWGLRPFGFHLSNLLWHIASAVLFLAACLSLRAPLSIATAAALLYAAHPIQSEAVCAIGFREDTQCAALCFAAFALWPSERHEICRVVAAIACFLAALTAKEMAFALPLLLIAKDCKLRRAMTEVADTGSRGLVPWRGLGRSPTRFAVHAVVWLAAGAFLALWASFRPDAPPAANVYADVPLWNRAAAFPAIVMKYIQWLVAPWPLSVERMIAMDGAVFWTSSVLGAVALAVVAALAWTGRRRFPAGWEGAVAFVLLLAPVSNLVAIYNPLGERYLTLPSAAFCWVVTHALFAVVKSEKARRAALATVVIVYVGLSWSRATEWRTPETLWRSATQREPRSPRAWLNLGRALTESGRPAEALEPLFEAQRLAPSDPRILNALGWTLNEQSRYEEALVLLSLGLRSAPNFAPLHINLTVAYMGLGDRENALVHAKRAVELAPDSAEARGNLGRLLD